MSHRTLSTAAGTVLVFSDAASACRAAADRIAESIRSRGVSREGAVLGLATGGTPIRVYQDLVARHKDGHLSFADVTSFNLDEYYPIGPLDPNSYRTYMHRHLFEHVDFAPNRAHVPDGTAPESGLGEACAAYDRWIADAGGIDLQLLGIGRNGHIGFNEPMDLPVADALELPTRPIHLAPETRALYARDFGGADRVPARALTMGIRPILAARSVLILAFGAAKAEPVARSVRGPLTSGVPGSLLQTVAERVTWMVDEAAAGGMNQ